MAPFRILPHNPASRFTLPGYHTWCASMVRSADGKCHLYASAWPVETGHEGWATHSRIVHAVSDNPLGPFEYRGVALGAQQADVWDRDVAHNPTVIQANGKCYLYYMGNFGNGEYWNHRNNQRIGVAVADSPGGTFERLGAPLLLPGTKGAWDDLLTTNPSCSQTPDGRFVLVYKAVSSNGPAPRYGQVRHGVAFSNSATGPFRKHPDPVFGCADAFFAAEDPFVWRQDRRFYCILKDQGRNFSEHERALVLFGSNDGVQWELEANPVVTTRKILHTDGSQTEFDRLERPQLFFENGFPTVLYVAVKPSRDSNESYSIFLPVACDNEQRRGEGVKPSGPANQHDSLDFPIDA